MRVWRKTTTRYVSANGKRTTSDDPKAKRITEKSKRFYGTLTLANGKRKRQPLTEDKTSSVTLLRRLQTQEDTKRASGVTADVERRQKPITGFVDGYKSYLTSKGNGEQHVSMTIGRIRSLLKETKANTIDNLNSNLILKTLSEWRGRKRKPISVRTSNHYLIAVKSFSRWLYQERLPTQRF